MIDEQSDLADRSRRDHRRERVTCSPALGPTGAAVDLPDGSGLDVVAEVATAASVVMISAHDDPGLVRRAMQEGALGYIRKDTEPVDLLRLVRRGAEGRTALTGDMAVRVAESLRRDPDDRAFDAAIASLSPRQREVAALVAGPT
jgi:two-component system uhpT operon response regulator UhpA